MRMCDVKCILLAASSSSLSFISLIKRFCFFHSNILRKQFIISLENNLFCLL